MFFIRQKSQLTWIVMQFLNFKIPGVFTKGILGRLSPIVTQVILRLWFCPYYSVTYKFSLETSEPTKTNLFNHHLHHNHQHHHWTTFHHKKNTNLSKYIQPEPHFHLTMRKPTRFHHDFTIAPPKTYKRSWETTMTSGTAAPPPSPRYKKFVSGMKVDIFENIKG